MVKIRIFRSVFLHSLSVGDGKDFFLSQLLKFSDGFYTINVNKTLQRSIVTKHLTKLFKQVIDFSEARVYS